jgi:hypothetical protein
MRFQFHIGSLLSFFILVLLIHEAHELGHHLSTRLVCGYWCTRDFLFWSPLCSGCLPPYGMIIFSFAGPLINYLFMWTGFILLHPSKPVEKRYIGFALVMAALPLPRLLAAAGRGGDEVNTTRLIFDTHETFKGAPVIAGGLIVLLLSLPPLWRAFRTIRNKQRLLIFLAFLVIPWQLDELVITKVLNGYLASSGFIMKPVYFGIPLLIIIWEIILLAGFLITRRQLIYLQAKEKSLRAPSQKEVFL